MRSFLLPGLIGTVACAPASPPEVAVTSDGRFVEIQASRPFREATLRNAEDEIVEVRRLPAPLTTLALPFPGLAVDGAMVLRFSDQEVTLPFSVSASEHRPPARPSPGQIEIEALIFPADRDGLPLAGVVEGALTLGPRWWTDVLRVVPGVGYRPADPEISRAFHAVTLRNDGDEPADVVVRLGITGPKGEPDPAWAPRARGASTTQVQTLIRLPRRASTTVTLPVWLDESQITEEARLAWREVAVSALNVDTPLDTARAPLAVRRSSPVGTAAAGGAILAGFLGLLGVAIGSARVLPRWPIADQLQIAMFAALLFLVGLAGQGSGILFTAFLGPVSIFVTALFDGTLRAAVLLGLLHLVPRPGAVGLTLAVAWLVRSALFGGFTLLDGLHAGGQIFWLELFILISGVLRSPGANMRFANALVALTAASLCSTASALALQTTLLRLWLEPTFVAAWLLGPAGLYVALGCAIAWRPALALRSIA